MNKLFWASCIVALATGCGGGGWAGFYTGSGTVVQTFSNGSSQTATLAGQSIEINYGSQSNKLIITGLASNAVTATVNGNTATLDANQTSSTSVNGCVQATTVNSGSFTLAGTALNGTANVQQSDTDCPSITGSTGAVTETDAYTIQLTKD